MSYTIPKDVGKRKPRDGEAVQLRLPSGELRRIGTALRLADGRLLLRAERRRSKHFHRLSRSWGIAHAALGVFDVVQIVDTDTGVVYVASSETWQRLGCFLHFKTEGYELQRFLNVSYFQVKGVPHDVA